MRLDFPALGIPKRPTSAIIFNSKATSLDSPGVPGEVCLGARLTDDLNLALPSP